MNYTNLGRTGCRVSRLCLGTMNFGERAKEDESRPILSRALELGIDFWDTADRYGGANNSGRTEEILGRWFADHAGKRDQIVLATKFQGQMGPGANDRGASAIHIRNACEASLRRMKTDRIDLYQMHHVNRDTPWEEVYQAFDVLIQQGKIIYAGSSNHAGWQIAAACEAAKRTNRLGIVSEQSKYSLACRYIELEVLPACRHYGVGVIPWSPLDGGMLGGVLSGEKGMRRDSEGAKKKVDARREQLQKWEGFCKELGEKPADVALAWMLHIEGVTAPIIGPRTMEQLNQSLRALEIKLSPEAMKALDQIWPPVGVAELQTQDKPFKYEAPEAYAW
jgi:aryl-alcohol dehydrogenase-like predicted oxidoreductase